MLSFNLNNLLILILALLIAIFAPSAFYYRAELKQASAKLDLARAENESQAKAIGNYEAQIADLNKQLTFALSQAEHRKNQVNEVLSREKNKNWSNQPVPDDVRRLFNQREQQVSPKNSLPENNRMSQPKGKNSTE